MSKKLTGIVGLVIALGFLLAVNVISNTALKGMKADLTEGRLYTLTDGSRNVLRGIEEPVTLRFFYSEKLAAQAPGLINYGKRVRELLEEYTMISGGRISLEVIDPEPFSEEEEQAVRAGMQGIPISRSERLYFGLEGVNSTDGKGTIAFFDPSQEQFLEYNVTKLVYDLANPERRNLTIITDLPINGAADPMAAMTGQQGTPPWVIYNELSELYDTTVIDSTATELPQGKDDKTDVLLILHPKRLSDELLYSIDQYVLGGGSTIVCVDPLADVEQVPSDPRNPLQAMQMPKNSDLPRLFESWGIKLVSGKLVGDRERAQQAMVGSQSRPELVDYVFWLGLGTEDFDTEDSAFAALEKLNLASAGVLEKVEGATTSVTPILESSPQSMLYDVASAQMFPDPKQLLKDFKSDDKKQMLGARISGSAKTAFPGGYKPPAEEGLPAPEANPNHVEQGDAINVVVFSDVDFVSDNMWVRVQRFLNMQIPSILADNGYLVMNLVDQMSGSEDLIGIRARGKSQRPFTLIEEMEKRAAERSQEKVANLEKELEETQNRLRELQRDAPDGSGMLIATSDLKEEIEKFELKEIQTNKELRQVEREKRQEIESLESRLKFWNIAALPVLIGIFAVGMGTLRGARRRRRQ